MAQDAYALTLVQDCLLIDCTRIYMTSRLTLHILVLINLMLWGGISYAQKAQGPVEVLIYTSPLRSVPYINSGFATLGIETIIKEKVGISIEAGVKYADATGRRSDTSFVASEGFSARAELKLYENGLFDSRFKNDYLSIEYRYVSDNYNERYCFYRLDDFPEGGSFEDGFGVSKQVHMLTAKYGMLITWGKRFYFDPYIGLGLRYRQMTNTDRLELDESCVLCGDQRSWRRVHWEEYSGFSPNFSLGFKVGLRL